MAARSCARTGVSIGHLGPAGPSPGRRVRRALVPCQYAWSRPPGAETGMHWHTADDRQVWRLMTLAGIGGTASGHLCRFVGPRTAHHGDSSVSPAESGRIIGIASFRDE